VISEQFDRAFGRPPDAQGNPVVRMLAFVGSPTKAQELFREVSRMVPGLRTMVVSPTSVGHDGEREARRVLSSLFGSPTMPAASEPFPTEPPAEPAVSG